MPHKFVRKTDVTGKPQKTVWENAVESDQFTDAEKLEIKEYWNQYVADLGEVTEDELKQIELSCLDKSRNLSCHWREWGAETNVGTVIDWDYSKTLEAQRNDARDGDTRIRDAEEQHFAGSLMCCDTPERTIAFLVAVFADHTGLPLGERLKLGAEVAYYVYLQMIIAFICKWETEEERPSDAEVRFGKSPSAKSVSWIPHPNHPSNPSGHSTIGQAAKKYISEKYHGTEYQPDKDWLQLTDEVGVARIAPSGIHFWRDHQAAIDNVAKWHGLAMSKMPY